MNKPDKHKPLSAEELFKLLENRENLSTRDGDMDDFEREALDGFSGNFSLMRAKELTDEINQKISERVAEKIVIPVSTKKNKLIWFAAAASLLILICISFVFMNEVKNEHQDLAIKELPKEITVSAADQPKSETNTIDSKAPAFSTIESEKGKSAAKDEKVMVKDEIIALEERSVKADQQPGNYKEPQLEGKTAKDIAGSVLKDATKIGQAENITEDDKVMDLESKPINAEDKLLVSKNAIKKEEEAGNGYALAQNAPTSTTVNGESANEPNTRDKKSKLNKNSTSQKSVEVYNNQDVSEVEESTPAISNTPKVAYYPGGEKVIKEYLVSSFEEKTVTGINLSGIYKIRLTVFENGTVKVKTVTATTEAGKKAIPELIKSFEKMENWNPAIINNHISKSEVLLELSF